MVVLRLNVGNKREQSHLHAQVAELVRVPLKINKSIYMYMYIYICTYTFVVDSTSGTHFWVCMVNKWDVFAYNSFLVLKKIFFLSLGRMRFQENRASIKKNENKSLGSISGTHGPQKI